MAGRNVETPVSLVDIVPTVAARFGLAPEPSDGVDLSPLLDGTGRIAPRPLFAEGILHGPQRWSVRAPSGKLISTPHPDLQMGEGKRWPVPSRAPVEVYLPTDAGEIRDVAADRPRLRAELMTELRRHIAAATRQIAPAAAAQAVPEATEDRLRELGYMD